MKCRYCKAPPKAYPSIGHVGTVCCESQDALRRMRTKLRTGFKRGPTWHNDNPPSGGQESAG